MKRASWLAVALIASGTIVWLQHHRLQNAADTRFDLPDFDAYVNVAAAEHPAFFTAAPWGYRLLTARLVHALPAPKVTRGFRYLTLGGLTAAGGVLFLFLIRTGAAPWVALAGVVLFALSEPVALLVAHGFLTEPLGVLLLLLFLLGAASGVGTGVIALVLALLALDGDLALALVPAVVLLRRERGWVRATGDAALAGLPALAIAMSLRVFWGPESGTAAAMGGDVLTPEAAGLLRPGWSDGLGLVTLGVVMPLAAIGALRRDARPFLRRYGLAVLIVTALPVLSLLEPGGGGRPASALLDGGPELLVYALVLWLPLTALAVRRRTGAADTPGPGPPTRAFEVAAWAAAFGLVAMLPLALDGYRRVDVAGRRDGPFVLALTRESLRTARRLERGERVRLDAASHRYAWGLSDPGRLGRMRWFLWDGFGPLAHYGIGDVVLRGPQARLLLPCFRPRAIEAVFVLEAEHERRVAVFVNGSPLGEVLAGPGGARTVVALPRSALLRGDNLLTLAVRGAAPETVRLREVTYRPAPASR